MVLKISMPLSSNTSLTIGKLAKFSGVGVETIRYYQQLGLLPVPVATGAYRHYPASLVSRIRFIKRAQELGFSLSEIADLLSFEDGADRCSIRRLANEKLEQIQAKLRDLNRMKKVLSQLIHECEETSTEQPCPIISTLAKERVST